MDFKKFSNFIASKPRFAVILRGVHGSGKTAFAEALKEDAIASGKTCTVVSFDRFFEDDDGKYKYDPSRHDQAVSACFNEFLDACEEVDVVIYDNTNIKAVDLAPFVLAAQSSGTYGVPYGIVTLHEAVDTAIQRNQKKIPDSRIFDSFRELHSEVLPYRWHRFEIF